MKTKIDKFLWIAIPVIGAVAVFYFICVNPPVFLQILMKLFGEFLIVAAAVAFIISIAKDWFRKYIKGVVKEVRDE